MTRDNAFDLLDLSLEGLTSKMSQFHLIEHHKITVLTAGSILV